MKKVYIFILLFMAINYLSAQSNHVFSACEDIDRLPKDKTDLLIIRINRLSALINQYGNVVDIAEAYYLRGEAYNLLAKYDSSIADLNAALNIKPKLVLAWYERAIVYAKLANYQNALNDVAKAIVIDPQRAELYNLRGCVYEHLDNYSLAITDFKTALGINVNFVEARENLARLEQNSLSIRLVAPMLPTEGVYVSNTETLTVRFALTKGEVKTMNIVVEPQSRSPKVGRKADNHIVLLNKGLNTIKISATNEFGQTATLFFQARYEPPLDTRTALIVTNEKYEVKPLSFPHKDGNDIKQQLAKRHFDIQQTIDLIDNQAFVTGIDNFTVTAQSKDVVLFYYAGHGVEIQGNQHLVGINNAKERLTPHFNLFYLLGAFKRIQNKQNKKLFIIVLDACRDEAATRNAAEPFKDLEQHMPENTLIVFGNVSGETVTEGCNGNGCLTRAILEVMNDEKQLTISDFFNLVRDKLSQLTNGRQRLVQRSTLGDNIFKF